MEVYTIFNIDETSMNRALYYSLNECANAIMKDRTDFSGYIDGEYIVTRILTTSGMTQNFTEECEVICNDIWAEMEKSAQDEAEHIRQSRTY